MKKIRWERGLSVLYPILVYLVIYEGVDFALSVLLTSFFPGREISPLWPLVLAAAVTLIPIYRIYRLVPVPREEKLFDEKTPRQLLMAAAVVLVGVILNILAAKLPLEEISGGYREANAVLFQGSLALMILSNVILIPVLEEVLYRGILCGQLSLWYGERVGVILSALLFGLFHFNIVQFTYAVVMGVLLGILFYRSHRLYLSWLAHAVTNLLVILSAYFSG